MKLKWRCDKCGRWFPNRAKRSYTDVYPNAICQGCYKKETKEEV